MNPIVGEGSVVVSKTEVPSSSEEKIVYKLLGLSLLLVGSASFASATPVAAPEIDGASATSAIALLSGSLLVMRARRKK